MIVYAAPGKDARTTPAWAAFALLWAGWLLANLATLPFVLLILLPMGGDLPAAERSGLILILTLYVMFSVFALLAMLWMKRYERRSLRSAGIIWRGAFWRYGRGLLWGLAFALALFGFAALLSVFMINPDKPPASISMEVLRQPATLLVLAILLLGIMLQSAAEEIICRGWLLSTLAKRFGPIAGVFLSSIFFGSLHAHFLFTGNLAAGLVAIVSVTLIGVMLGFYALREGSIIGVCGIHGAFNAIIFSAALVATLTTGEADNALAGLQRAFEIGTQPKHLTPVSFAQGGLALIVAVLLWWRLPPKFRPAKRRSRVPKSA